MFTFFQRPIASIARFAHYTHRRHEQIRTQRVLNSLPEYLRKDIGWPDREFERETRVPAAKASRKLWDTEAMLAKTECPAMFGLDKSNLHVRNGA